MNKIILKVPQSVENLHYMIVNDILLQYDGHWYITGRDSILANTYNIAINATSAWLYCGTTFVESIDTRLRKWITITEENGVYSMQ